MDLTLWIELILFAILMGFSAFFSSSETSLFSLNEIQLEQMRRDDHPRINLIERLLSEPRRLIVTILIGNEFVNVAASVISAAIVIRLLGAENKLLNLFIMVPILLLVGEITPKTLAIRNNVAFAGFQSQPIEWFARLIKPLRWVVRLVADWVTTLIVGRERTRGSLITEDMVRVMAREAVGEGVLDQSEAGYIDQIFDFGNKTVEDVMTPRSAVLFMTEDMPVSDLIAELRRTARTKVPIYRGHRDNVVGILYARDLLGVNLEHLAEKPARFHGLLREPFFVPESKPAVDLFHAFRKQKRSLALTVDEYGGVTGLVTMEDLLESIFGEIPSASDAFAEQMEFEKLANGTTRVDGAMTIEEFSRAFGGSLPESSAETIGGLVLNHHGELPAEGTAVEVGPLEFTVEVLEQNRISALTVKRIARVSEEGSTGLEEQPVPQEKGPEDSDTPGTQGRTD